MDNSVPATAFKDMNALATPGEREENETEKGLRLKLLYIHVGISKL